MARAPLYGFGTRVKFAPIDGRRRPAIIAPPPGVGALGIPGRAPKPIPPAKIFEDFDFKQAFDVRSGQGGPLELRSDAGVFFHHSVGDSLSRRLSQTHGISNTLGPLAGITAAATLTLTEDSIIEAIIGFTSTALANLEWVRVEAVTPNGIGVLIFLALGTDGIVMAAANDVIPNRLPFRPYYLKADSSIKFEVRATGLGQAIVEMDLLTQRTTNRAIPIQRAGA